MSSHLNLEDQEQLDELKHFWKSWGDLITWVLISVLGGYAAWMGWQSYQGKQAAQAAALYDTVERAALGGDLALLDRSVNDIEEKFASTTYAQQAALLAARVYNDKDRKADAKKQLTWVINQASDEGYQTLARLRLSSLLVEEKAYDEARKQLTAKTPEAFAPLMADRLGDLAMLQSQPAEAVQHYKNAWKGFEPNADYRRLVAVKLAALGADPEDTPAVESKKVNTTTSRWTHLTRFALAGVCVALTACSGPSRPKPTEIQGVPVLQEVRTGWSTNVGKVDFPLVVSARGDHIALANSLGVVAVLDATTGKDVWRIKLDQAISAGVGSDGQQLAVVTRNNELVTLRDGKVQWRKTLPAQSFTAPLVAGARVFVLTADRAVLAFDGATGRQLWTQQRPGEPLVLKQAGVMLAFKNTLLVGLSGRLAGLDPNTGVIRWESAIATPRGTNDIERLVDLVGPFDRVGDVVCVRAFQTSVGCVNAERGQGVWTRPSAGEMGVSGNDTLLIAPMSNGVVQAFNRSNGERLWETERLKYRILSAPLVTPRGVLVADNGGWLYLLSLADGALLNRIKLDSEELAAAPVFAGGRYVVVTREGRVTGLQIP